MECRAHVSLGHCLQSQRFLAQLQSRWRGLAGFVPWLLFQTSLAPHPPSPSLSLNMGAQSQSAMVSDAAAALASLRDGSDAAGATLALVPFPHTTTAVATEVATAVALLCSWLSTPNTAARDQNPEVTWLHLREGEGRWGKLEGR